MDFPLVMFGPAVGTVRRHQPLSATGSRRRLAGRPANSWEALGWSPLDPGPLLVAIRPVSVEVPA